jgi:TRAP-type C4-dicarboxylate transport system permease small subunit
MMVPLAPLLHFLRRAVRIAEDALLVVSLTAMIVLAAGQIALRNFGGGGFVWTDELLRILVLWIALLGAVAASRDANHITIDLLTRHLHGKILRFVRVVVDLFTAAVCGTLAYYSWRFVEVEREFGSLLLETVPAWMFQLILPVGFALIGLRYVCHGLSRKCETSAPPEGMD